MFTATLFTIAKTCKQPKCPSTDKEDVLHTYNGNYLAIKKEWNVTGSNMGRPRDYPIKWS